MVSSVVVPFPITTSPLMIMIPMMALPLTIPVVIPVPASFPMLPVLATGIVIRSVISISRLVSPMSVPTFRPAITITRPRLRLLPVILFLLPLLVMDEVIKYRRRMPIRMHYPQHLSTLLPRVNSTTLLPFDNTHISTRFIK